MIAVILMTCILYCLFVLFAAFCTQMRFLPSKVVLNATFFQTRSSADKIFFIEIFIFGLSLYLNLLLGIMNAGGDAAFFVSVIEQFTSSGSPFSGFYANDGISYPPLFNYLYYILAQIIQLLGIPVSYTNEAFILAVKLPGILCEFLMAWLLYRYAKKKLGKGQTIPILLLTLLNPAFLFVTAYICQIDALYVFFMLLTVMLIYEHRLKAAYFTFGAAILCKFQTIFITPVIIYATIHDVFLCEFSWKKFCSHLFAGLSAIFCMYLSYLPFVWDFAAGNYYRGGVSINFTNSIKSYGFASQNTYNLWTLLGYNSLSEELYFGPFTCTAWGTFFLIVLVVLSSVLFWRRKNDASIYPMLGALLVSGTVCFATRMMARYLYPAVPFVIFGFILKPTGKRFLCVLGFSTVFLLLTFFNYMIYPLSVYTPQLILPRIISVYFLGCFVFLAYTIFYEK